MRPTVRRLLTLSSQSVFLTLALFLLLGQVSPRIQVPTQDEMTMVWDSVRVARGEVPYRDFFNFTPPGAFYALAPLCGPAGGRPITAARYAIIAAVIFQSLFAFLALRVSGWTRGLAGAGALLLPVGLWPFAPFAPHHWMALAAFALLAWVVVVALKAEARTGLWVAAGACAGLCGWFLQSEGILALTTLGLGALACGKTPRGAMRRLGMAALGCAGASIVLWATLIMRGAVDSSWRAVILWPGTHYAQPGGPNDRPILWDLGTRLGGAREAFISAPVSWGGLGGLAGLALYPMLLILGVILVTFSLVKAASALRRPGAPSPAGLAVAGAVLVAFGGWIRVNPNWVHLIYALAPSLLLGGLVWVPGSARSRRSAAICLGILLGSGLLYHGRALWCRFPEGWELVDADRVVREGGLNISLHALPFMKDGDPLTALPAGADVYLYGFPSAMGYTYLFPLEDRYNDLDDHRRAVAQMAKSRPKLVLVHRVRENAFLAPGPVSDFLAANYRRWSETPAVAVYLRKNISLLPDGCEKYKENAGLGQGQAGSPQ